MSGHQSFHNHTTCSDGELTHRALLEVAKKYGYSTIAFTDHDTLVPTKVVYDLKAKPVEGIRWISGVEISSALPRELGSRPHGGFHIVGLNVDPTNEALRAHCVQAQDSRRERMSGMVKNLRGLGFNITEDECIRISAGETVTRPHIVSALLAHSENRTVIEILRARMEQEALTNQEINASYMRMMERGPDHYPYTLFLGQDSFIPGIYVDYLYSIDMDETVRLIRAAGGKAFLAHYTTARRQVSFELLERILNARRLDGVETIYGLQSFGTSEEARVMADRSALREIAVKTGCLISGGADAHREDELARYAARPDLGGASRDLVV